MDYEYDAPVRKGHGGLALAFGLTGLALTIFVGGFFGMFGVVPGAVLSAVSIALGFGSLRSTGGRSGKGGLITGIISILFCIIIGGMTVAIVGFLHTDEVREDIPTLAAYADDGWKGIGGMLMSMTKDGVDYDQLGVEIDAYNAKHGVPQTSQKAQTSQTTQTKKETQETKGSQET